MLNFFFFFFCSIKKGDKLTFSQLGYSLTFKFQGVDCHQVRKSQGQLEADKLSVSYLWHRMTVLELGLFLFLINVGQSWRAESTSAGPVIKRFCSFPISLLFFLFCASGTSVKSFEHAFIHASFLIRVSHFQLLRLFFWARKRMS